MFDIIASERLKIKNISNVYLINLCYLFKTINLSLFISIKLIFYSLNLILYLPLLFNKKLHIIKSINIIYIS